MLLIHSRALLLMKKKGLNYILKGGKENSRIGLSVLARGGWAGGRCPHGSPSRQLLPHCGVTPRRYKRVGGGLLRGGSQGRALDGNKVKPLLQGHPLPAHFVVRGEAGRVGRHGHGGAHRLLQGVQTLAWVGREVGQKGVWGWVGRDQGVRGPAVRCVGLSRVCTLSPRVI